MKKFTLAFAGMLLSSQIAFAGSDISPVYSCNYFWATNYSLVVKVVSVDSNGSVRVSEEVVVYSNLNQAECEAKLKSVSK